MDEITIVVNTRPFVYNKSSKVLQLPFIKNLVEFEGAKNVYSIQLPGAFGSAWKNYTDYLDGKRDFKCSRYTSSDKPHGKKPIQPKKVYAELAEYVMDRETMLKFVCQFPQICDYDFLIDTILHFPGSANYRFTMLTEAYNKNQKDMVERALQNCDMFETLCMYEIYLMQRKYNPSPFDEYGYIPNVPGLIFEHNVNLDEFPLVKELMKYIDSCETAHDFTHKPRQPLSPVKKFVLNTLVVVGLKYCTCGLYFDAEKCNCDLFHLKYNDKRNYIIGSGTSSYGKDVGVYYSPRYKLKGDVFTIKVEDDYYDSDTYITVYPWFIA